MISAWFLLVASVVIAGFYLFDKNYHAAAWAFIAAVWIFNFIMEARQTQFYKQALDLAQHLGGRHDQQP